ncbi:MAG: ATP-binding cassette domain-containing protein [Deltaproteobacteria bacterium]|nr:ATP-binding cassette domain-containing protein [Deltaproteobacteria bacterium]
MAQFVEIKELTSYSEDGRAVFENAGLILKGGERVLITAPVASGKSLLLKLLSGIEKPEKGQVLIFGEDTSAIDNEALNRLRSRLGFVFQDNVLISNLKVLENIALPLLYHSNMPYDEVMERALELLDKTGFRGDPWVQPGSLALYSKKEVAVARAMALEPDIIVCESLCEGLTEAEKGQISDLLIKYQENSNRLLVFTAVNDADAGLLRPDRVIRIEGNRFLE